MFLGCRNSTFGFKYLTQQYYFCDKEDAVKICQSYITFSRILFFSCKYRLSYKESKCIVKTRILIFVIVFLHT